MYDYSKKVSEFHKDHVRLTNDERSDMRKRRETNLQRVHDGLAELEKPEVVETINQGGYAQKTMTQPPEADGESRYDIDLGVVFEEEDALGARTTRNWVRDAIAKKATKMKYAPETKKKCVRVVYADGYQCDFPVFRRKWKETGWTYELSSGDEWVASDPRSMNTWVDLQVSTKSPEQEGSYQLRRIIRLLKFFCKVHAHRTGLKYPSGLVATALAVECYSAQEGRDDLAFRETLRALSNR
ncbi:MAG: cyclic GMP-AMP synthase DncV-like nucleotidyltransferase [Gammaproteobacteria bacterium]